ncbi:Nucleolar protein 56 [Ceratocystis lukuohia]|uniref:Nucleolar protein 56 n=2 Tax=Ceratocystis TaxID=5157 RepID=A0A0F8CVB7_CERFI|nr:Nucleolar protein 56 [Ceratocystis platani]
MTQVDYLLYDSVLGYALFKVVHQVDTVALRNKENQDSFQDLAKFGKMIRLENFSPFHGHVEAYENVQMVTEGGMPDYLKTVLEAALPQTSGKKSKVTVGVTDKVVANAIKGAFSGIECETTETSEAVDQLFRGVREFASKLLSDVREDEAMDASRAMAHAASRSKVKFNATRHDNHVIQASSTVEFQDKSVNQFFMRVREWYGHHFPELLSIVSDNLTYSRLVLEIGDKSTLTQDRLHDIAKYVEDDEAKAQAIIDLAQSSMGPKISQVDMDMVQSFAKAVVEQAEARRYTSNYLDNKMGVVAPNLKTLIGTTVAARLISQAGSLSNLAKYPASTLQIIGAEKALFRALKTKGNTPKYGILYHSSFIGKAGARHKGRISRYLANKCSIASRIDCFSGEPSTKFGDALKSQVEDRLEFYATGKKPSKNADVMDGVIEDIRREEEGDDDVMDIDEAPAVEKKKEKKDKKDKKDKKEKKEKRKSIGGEEGESKKKKSKKSKE